MGTHYGEDRIFTDYVHNNLAIPLIYHPLCWDIKEMDKQFAIDADMYQGIDYFLQDKNQKLITVQERFREEKYYKNTDFTVRFEREYNPHEDRKLSEYYKLNADFFVYGIINSSKDKKEEATNFLKYAVIDLSIIRHLMDNEKKIVIDRRLNSFGCVIKDGIMRCPVKYNKDYSSSFFPIDIVLLSKYFNAYHPIVVQKGFN